MNPSEFRRFLITTCAHRAGCQRVPRWSAFTLVEVLVSVAVLALLLVLLLGLSEQVTRSWKRAGGQAAFFSDAREAMDLVARRLGQATLNTYWAYDDPAEPERYLRESDLRFLIVDAGALLGSGFGPGSAVFFQAPLGRSQDPGNRQMTSLLNTVGFFVKKSDPPADPLSGAVGPARYTLIEVQAPAEEMTAFSAGSAGDASWAVNAASGAFARPLAENVILFLARPMVSDADGIPLPIGSGFAYNSAENSTADPQPDTANQLPPIVEITMVVLDSASAARFEASGLTLQGRFTSSEEESFRAALDDLASDLTGAGLDFRILQTRAALPNSKWNG